LTKFGFAQQFLVKAVSMKFHGDLSGVSNADTFGRTDIMKLIGAFRNYAKARENAAVSVLGTTGLFPF
jgi:hypothetical protein